PSRRERAGSLPPNHNTFERAAPLGRLFLCPRSGGKGGRRRGYRNGISNGVFTSVWCLARASLAMSLVSISTRPSGRRTSPARSLGIVLRALSGSGLSVARSRLVLLWARLGVPLLSVASRLLSTRSRGEWWCGVCWGAGRKTA